MRHVTILICSLFMAALLFGCSKKAYNPTPQRQARVSAGELNRLLTEGEQGDAEAQFKLGNMYYNGVAVPVNYTDAMKWYRKAALQGHAEAQFSLGLMYDKGHIGIPKNNEHAYIWYKFASEQEIEDAKRNFISIESLMTTSEIERADRKAAELEKKITGK